MLFSNIWRKFLTYNRKAICLIIEVIVALCQLVYLNAKLKVLIDGVVRGCWLRIRNQYRQSTESHRVPVFLHRRPAVDPAHGPKRRRYRCPGH